MESILAAVSLVASVVALAGVALLFLNRQETGNVESKIRSIELELADLVDRLSVWQRRDAARQRRNVSGDAADVSGGQIADQHSAGGLHSGKDHLRSVARQRGLIR